LFTAQYKTLKILGRSNLWLYI